jgi:hypothetical protein
MERPELCNTKGANDGWNGVDYSTDLVQAVRVHWAPVPGVEVCGNIGCVERPG